MASSRDLLILFLAAAIPLVRPLFFGDVILDNDVFLQSLPAWEWLSRNLRSGESILWSSEILGGFPIAFTQYPFLYPPDLLLAWVLPPTQAYAWSLVLHLWAAGILTYSFCRLLGLRPMASLLAALSYQMSSEVVAGSSGFSARTAFVLPGIFITIELVLRKGWRYGPALSLLMAAALLGGHPQIVLMGLSAGAMYGLFRLGSVAQMEKLIRSIGLAGLLLIAGLLGVAAAAVRLLPMLEVVGFSTRSAGLPAEAAGLGSLTIQGLIVGYLLPLSRLQELSWGAPGYAGPAAVVMVAVGFRWVLSQYWGRFFIALGALTALLSLGDLTPLGSFTRLPLFSLFREASRLTLITTFCLAMVGGAALDGFIYRLKETSQLPKRWTMVLAALAAISTVGLLISGWIFQYGAGPTLESYRLWIQLHALDALNPLRPRMIFSLAGMLITSLAVAMAARGRLSPNQLEKIMIIATAGVLVPLAAILNPTISIDVIKQMPETARFISKQGESGRVFSHRPGTRLYNHTHYYGPGPEAGFTDDLKYRFQAEMLASMLNLRWGIPSADGYEQLHSRYQELLLRYIDSERVSDWIHAPGRWAHLNMEQRLRVLRMLGVQYILSATDLSTEAPDLRIVAEFEVEPGPASRASPSVFILENTKVIPRYYLVSKARWFSSDADILDAVALGDADPADTVFFVEGEIGNISAQGACVDAADNDQLQSLLLHNDEMTFKITNSCPSYLVTNDAFWPGWRAWVDGREVQVLRSNAGGMAVFLQERGIHTVTLRFYPPGYTFGGAVSLISALIWLGWISMAVCTRHCDAFCRFFIRRRAMHFGR